VNRPGYGGIDRFRRDDRRDDRGGQQGYDSNRQGQGYQGRGNQDSRGPGPVRPGGNESFESAHQRFVQGGQSGERPRYNDFRGNQGQQGQGSARPHGNSGYQPPRRDGQFQGNPQAPQGRPHGNTGYQPPQNVERAPRDGDMDGYRSRRSFGQGQPREPKEWTPVDGESGIVCGMHAVEALMDTTPGRIQRLLLLRGSSNAEQHKLQARGEDLGIPCQQLEQRQMDIKGEGHRHGGVIALCNARDYTEWGPLRRILLDDVDEGGSPIVIVGAAIEDPRNLGAIIRSAVGLGAKALILPKKGGCGLTGIVDETSAGALSYLPVSRPADLEAVLKDLSSKGFKIVGLDSTGELPSKVDLKGPMVLVAGGEDRGLPPHLRRPCDQLLRLPMDERLQSYNASVAAALALYEAARQRAEA